MHSVAPHTWEVEGTGGSVEASLLAPLEARSARETFIQVPASSEEFKVLKDNYIKEEEEKKEKAKNQKPIKEKPGKNYIPTKYENKSKINYSKIFLTILIISIIGIAVSFENREYILNKNPEFADFFGLLEEFVEYLKIYYSDIIETFNPKQK